MPRLLFFCAILLSPLPLATAGYLSLTPLGPAATPPVPSGQDFGLSAIINSPVPGDPDTVQIWKGTLLLGTGTGGVGITVSEANYGSGNLNVTYTAKDPGIFYAPVEQIVSIAERLPQAPVSSQNATVTFDQLFTPTYAGGTGTGNWQFVVGNYTGWPNGVNDGASGTQDNWSTTLWTAWPPFSVANSPYNVWVRKMGDEQYAESNTAGHYSLTVTKATPTAPTINSATTTTYGNSYTGTATGGGDGAFVWQLVSGGATINSSTGVVTVTGTGAVQFRVKRLEGSNYFESPWSSTFTLQVNKKALTVTAQGANKIYGSANPAFTVNFSGFVNGDTAAVISGVPTFSTGATTNSNVGSYSITPQPGTLAATNYSFGSFVNGSLTVSKRALTVTANNASRPYGVANPPFTASYSGFVSGDTAAVISGAASFSTPATTSSSVGTYSIIPTVGTLSATNYSFSSFVNGTLTIITASQSDVSYEGPLAVDLDGTFQPTLADQITGGSGTGAYQWLISGIHNWPENGEEGARLGESSVIVTSWTPTEAGAYDLWIRKVGDGNYLTSAGYGPYSLQVIDLPPDLPAPDPQTLPDLPTIDSEDLVGTLSGEFSVDNRGSANYTIPLRIPTGRAGMQPNLAISYSSAAGNGPMGVGFSLSTGFPQSITRGRTILARDGIVDGPDYDANDKYYLDGKRLIKVSGTEGQPGSTYRTEVDSFVTVAATGSAGNIETFVVTDKNGVEMTFGKLPGGADDAYHEGGGEFEGKAYAYLIKRVEDTVGNYCEFTYDDFGEGELQIASIAYTGFGVDPGAGRVDFHYSSDVRADTSLTYTAQRRFRNVARLEVIRAMFRSTGLPEEVARYILEYETAPSNGRSRLKKVKPLFRNPATDNFQNVPSSDFEWTNESANWAAVQDHTNLPDQPATSGEYPYSWGDFNGDGKDDYLSLLNGFEVFLSNGTGFTSAQTWFSGTPEYKVAVQGDFNGDGKRDLLYGTHDGTGSQDRWENLYAIVSNGTGFTGMNGAQGTPTFVVNTDEILRDPYVASTTNSIRNKEKQAVASRLVVADFTGDGRDDLLIHDYEGYFHLLKSTGTGFEAPVKSSEKGYGFYAPPQSDGLNHLTQSVPPNYSLSPMPVDVNGDGISDYAYVVTLREFGTASEIYNVHRKFEVAVTQSNGLPGKPRSWEAQSTFSNSFSGTGNEDAILHWVTPLDINADGLTDFLSMGDGKVEGHRWMLYINKGPSSAAVGNGEVQFLQVPGALPNTFTTGGVELYTYYNTVTHLSWGKMDLNRPNDLFSEGDSVGIQRLSAVESSGGDGMHIADMNNDGFPDLVWYVYEKTNHQAAGSNIGWWVSYGTGGLPLDDGSQFSGAYFTTPTKLAAPAGSLWNTSTMSPISGISGNDDFQSDVLSRSIDVDGDGKPDWARHHAFNGRKQNLEGIANSTGPIGDLVSDITDGLGQTTQIVYSTPRDDAVYTSGATVSYPIRELRSGSPIVADVLKDSGDDANPAHFSYQYSGNRLDLSGRGSLGFHSFVTLDRQTNLFKYQFLAQSFPMTGLTHREQTYRFWETSGNANFRAISSHDNTVVFDEVVSGAGARYGTVYPFMSKAIESRWEDGTTRHYPVSGNWSVDGSPESKPELLFTNYKTSPPAGSHITITAKSWFDDQNLSADPPETIPGGLYSTSDTDSGGQNVVVGTTDFKNFLDPAGAPPPVLPGKIKYGNLKKLMTDYGDGFTETVTTTYKPVTVGLSGLVDTVTTAVDSPDFAVQTAPVKSYSYWNNTPLVATEAVDAAGTELDFTKTYERNDPRGRITATKISGYNTHGSPGNPDYFIGGPYNVEQVTDYDDTFDLPKVVLNAHLHDTETQYGEETDYGYWLGQPVSVKDVNGAEITTQYDALGRTVLVTDELLDLQTDSEFVWTDGSTGSEPSVTVAPPSGVVGVTVTSKYLVRTTATKQPTVTAYFDRLGRQIQTVKDGYAGQKTITKTVYDDLGRVVAVSNPYLDQTTPDTYWTTTTYDALGRVVSVIAPNDTETTTSYHGRATAVTVDADDRPPQTNVTLVNAKGETIKVWNAEHAPAVSGAVTDIVGTPDIKYVLDGFGRMRQTITLQDSSPVTTATITATYDDLGNQISLNDPDKGNWIYANNALGQVVWQKDANLSVTVSTFDKLGRQLTRDVTENGAAGPTESTTWHYYGTTAEAGDNTTNAVYDPVRGWIGQPQRQELAYDDQIGAAGDYTTRTSQYYDTKGRLNTSLYEIDNQYYYTYLTYDAFNRIEHKDYFWRPAGLELNQSINPEEWQKFGLKYSYDSNYSYITSVDDSMGRNWWLADTTNEGYDYLDRPVLFQKGSGHWTKRTYDPLDELLTDIETGSKSGSSVTPVVQNLAYTWDGLGNLKSREIPGTSRSETFTYDILNRLTSSQVVGKAVRSTTYAENGNILSKTDVTNTTSGYTYDANKPHAVATAFGYSMEYDANGNMDSRMKSGETWKFRWAPFDKPRFISKDDVGSEFRYDANRQRAVHLKFDSMTGGANSEPEHYTTKKLYFGNRMEADFTNLASGAAQDWEIKNVRVYIDGPDGRTGSFEFHPNQTPSERAVPLVYHQDHLGSIDSVTEYGVTTATFAFDDNGNPSRYSYDPWGERRDPLDWDGAPATVAEVTPRGFTDHEMLDDLGLVHMNGRIYDGQIGRFLSADIIVESPLNLQSFNRYAYVFNNPLSKTDPSGYQSKADKALEYFSGAEVKFLQTALNVQAALPLESKMNLNELSLRTVAHGGASLSEVMSDPQNRAELLRFANTPDRREEALAEKDKRFVEVTPEVGLERVVGLIDVTPAAQIVSRIAKQESRALTEVVERIEQKAAVKSKLADKVADTARAGSDVVESAAERYPGVAADYGSRTVGQLQKTIRSTTETIAQHEKWLADPLTKISEKTWNAMSKEAREGLLKKWGNDIARNKAYLEIAEEALKKKE